MSWTGRSRRETGCSRAARTRKPGSSTTTGKCAIMSIRSQTLTPLVIHACCSRQSRLPQWWEKEAQEYLASHPKGDFRVRQWRFQGETNRKVSKYYRDSTAGDSPELMPLDSSLFNDLIEGVHRAVCSTSHRKMDGSHTCSTIAKKSSKTVKGESSSENAVK